MVSEDSIDPPTLDPQRLFGDRSHTLGQQMFEGLVRISPVGQIEPALAIRWTRVDDRTMEFSLRPAVTFHDGLPFDSRAVKASIERYLDPATGFPARGFLEPIESVETPGPLTVRIRTSRPDGLLLYRLAAFVLVVPPDVQSRVGPAALSDRPVGTGPFKFVRWVRGDRIEMEAFGGYWDRDQPRVKRLSFRFLAPDKRIAALLRGEVDVVPDLPGTYTLEITRSPGTKVVKSLSYLTYMATLNTASSVLKSRDLREALNVAVNREKLVRFYAKGNGRPLATTSMAGEFGHNPALTAYKFDPVRCKLLMARAGHPQGLKLKFLVKDTAQRLMAIIAQQWADQGIQVEQTFTNDAHMIEDLHNGSWDGFFAQSPDPMTHMGFLPGIGAYSRGPFSLVRSPTFDRAYEAMVSTVDPVQQETLCRDLDRMLHDEALYLFTFQQIRTYGVRREVDLVPFVTGMDRYGLTSKQEVRQ